MNNENLSNNSDEVEIDLRELFQELKHRWWIILVGLIVGVAVAGSYTVFAVKPTYSSTAMIYMRGSGNTIASLADLQIGSQLTNDYSVLFKSRTVLSNVIKDLRLNTTTGALANIIKISNPTDTRILEVTVENGDPQLACDIANKVIEYGADAAQEIDSKEPYVIDSAVVNTTPVSPSLKKNVLIGGLIGFLLVAGFFVVRYLLNDALQTESDVEKYLDLPVLCAIPESKNSKYDSGSKKTHKHKN